MVLSNVRNPINGTFSNTGKAASVISMYGESNNSYITFSTSPTNNTGPAERMRITSGGALLIGTTSANGRVNISQDQGSNNQFLNFTGTQSGFSQEWGFGIVNSSRDFRLYDYTNGVERIRITSAGNVGIGTTSPTGRLSVIAATGAAAMRVEADSGQNALSIGGSGNVSIDYPGIGGGRFLLNGDGALTIRSSMTASSFFESSDKTIKTLIEDNWRKWIIESFLPRSTYCENS
jgi:hypothetical protein